MAAKKVAVITGGARGIGLVTAKTFTDKGWDITIVDWDEAELETVAAHLPDALLLGYDVSDPGQASAIMSDTLQRFGRIDALINNAGVAAKNHPVDPPDNVDREDALKLFNINVIGMAKVTQVSGVLRSDNKGGKVNTGLLLVKTLYTRLSLVNTLR